MIKAVFFDFDGTIADTYPIAVRTANALLHDMQKPPLNDPLALRDHSALEVFRMSGIPLWKLPSLRSKAVALMANEMQHVVVFEGMAEVIEALREHYLVGVITSNGQEAVEAVLRKHKIGVDLVLAGSALFGKHLAIKAALRSSGLSPAQAIYVGDEVRDVSAAHAAGVRVLSVTWGFNSAEALRKASPDALIKDPAALFQAIRKLDRA